MRGRIILSLVSLSVMLVLTVLGARAFIPSSPSSAGNPLNVARNGFSGLCANAQATAAAGGADPSGAPATAVSPGLESQLQDSDPSGLSALRQAAGGSLICPTTTTRP